MSEAPAEGPPVADRGMRDMSNGLRQQWCVRGNFGRFLKLDMACQRANFEDISLHSDSP